MSATIEKNLRGEFALSIEAARFLGIGREMVYKLCGEGKLADVRRIGKTYLIPWSSLDAYAKSYVPRKLVNGYGIKVDLTCNGCSKPFSVQYGYRKRKYCSYVCSVKGRKRSNWHKRDQRTCPQCNKEFEVISWSKVKFCSPKCSTDWNRGKSNLRCKADVKTVPVQTSKKCTTPDGRKMLVHRHLAEIKAGRRLTEREVVHHVDMDHANNDPQNLCLMDDTKEHTLAHRSVDRLIKPLLAMGMIEFKDKRYVLGAAALRYWETMRTDVQLVPKETAAW
jgi:excisionase family DNA binding protein